LAAASLAAFIRSARRPRLFGQLNLRLNQRLVALSRFSSLRLPQRRQPGARCYLPRQIAKQRSRSRAGGCRTRSAAWGPPACLLIERRVAAMAISVHCHDWLRRVRHENYHRSPSEGLAKEPARARYSGQGYDRKPGSIQHGRFCPHPAVLRSRAVRQELRARYGRLFLASRDQHVRTTQWLRTQHHGLQIVRFLKQP
jgi:hypothetical protein